MGMVRYICLCQINIDLSIQLRYVLSDSCHHSTLKHVEASCVPERTGPRIVGRKWVVEESSGFS